MSHEVFDGRERNPALGEAGAEGMSEIVKAEVLDAGPDEKMVPGGVVQRIGVLRPGLGVREDVGTPDVPGERFEGRGDRVAHVHRPIALALRVPDDDLPFLEPDIRPNEVSKFRVAKTRVDGRDQNGGHVGGGEAEETLFLLSRKVADDLVGDLGLGHKLDGVSGDQFAFQRLAIHRGEHVELLADGGGGRFDQTLVGILLDLARVHVLQDERAQSGKDGGSQDALIPSGGALRALGEEVFLVVFRILPDRDRNDGAREIAHRTEPLKPRAFYRILAFGQNAAGESSGGCFGSLLPDPPINVLVADRPDRSSGPRVLENGTHR
jgi:hypothetical protein